jgi:hypothetical protein
VTGKGTKDEPQAALCKNKDTPVQEEVDDTIEGWEEKAKDMLQILWERGFIDPGEPNNLDHTLNGKKDARGNVILETGLKHLMSLQTDFIEEETLLQRHGRLLGIKTQRTPKSHPEIAGEGVKHDWGCLKGACRRLPARAKKSKTKFRESVRKCADPNEVLAVARQSLFSKRARECMPACSALDNGDEIGPSEGVDEANEPRMTASLIEKIVKEHKSHRSALDFDTDFINGAVDAMKNNQHEQQRISAFCRSFCLCFSFLNDKAVQAPITQGLCAADAQSLSHHQSRWDGLFERCAKKKTQLSLSLFVVVVVVVVNLASSEDCRFSAGGKPRCQEQSEDWCQSGVKDPKEQNIH